MAFLHIHPRISAATGPDVTFMLGPTPPGTYRCYFQFQAGDAVHTIEFTVPVR
jgi:hypothetical protein